MSQRANFYQNNWKIIPIADVPLVLEVKVVDNVTLHIKWAPVTCASNYNLIVWEDTESHPFKVELTVQGEALDVPDLKPDTRYCFTLSAKCSITQHTYSTTECITTGVSMWITRTYMSAWEK